MIFGSGVCDVGRRGAVAKTTGSWLLAFLHQQPSNNAWPLSPPPRRNLRNTPSSGCDYTMKGNHHYCRIIMTTRHGHLQLSLIVIIITSSVAAGFGRHGMPPPASNPDL